MADSTNISAADKLHCISRELKLRYRVYPRLVSEGKMSQRAATREIKIMEEIAADLRAQVQAEARAGAA